MLLGVSRYSVLEHGKVRTTTAGNLERTNETNNDRRRGSLLFCKLQKFCVHSFAGSQLQFRDTYSFWCNLFERWWRWQPSQISFSQERKEKGIGRETVIQVTFLPKRLLLFRSKSPQKKRAVSNTLDYLNSQCHLEGCSVALIVHVSFFFVFPHTYAKQLGFETQHSSFRLYKMNQDFKQRTKQRRPFRQLASSFADISCAMLPSTSSHFL